MADQFSEYAEGLDSPPKHAVAITPNDSVDLAITTRGFYVGVTGDIKVLMEGDTTAQTFVGIAAGVTHSGRIKRIYSTGTTATSIIGVY